MRAARQRSRGSRPKGIVGYTPMDDMGKHRHALKVSLRQVVRRHREAKAHEGGYTYRPTKPNR